MASGPVDFSFGAILAALADLHKITWHDRLLPISILATLHALRGALFARYQLAREPKTTERVTHIPWLQALIFNLVLSLGGSIVTAFLFGHHVSWLTSNQTLPLYCAVHFLVMYSPFDIVFKFIHTFWYIINPFLIVADGFARGFSMVSTVDFLRFSAHNDLQTSYVALILGGGFAACGGGLIVDFFGLNRIEWGVHTPRFVQKLPLGVKMTFLLAFGYVVSISPELPLHREFLTLLGHLSQFLLPGLSLAAGESPIDSTLIRFVFRALFVSFLLFDEFVNAPLIAFEAPGAEVPEGDTTYREVSDLSMLAKEEPASERSFLSPEFRRLSSPTRPSSAPLSKTPVSTQKPFGEERVLSDSPRTHVPQKSSKLA